MDTALPVLPPVHIYSTDLQGLAAIQATGDNGEEYCIIDSAVIADNPEMRECAYQVYIKAQISAAQRRQPSFAT